MIRSKDTSWERNIVTNSSRKEIKSYFRSQIANYVYELNVYN